jgi:TonB-linked SusC/RagA family outer membrane protein
MVANHNHKTMKNKNNKHLIWLVLLFGLSVAQAQTIKAVQPDSLKSKNSLPGNYLDGGFRTEQDWRSTGAVFTISGQDLGKTTAGNLLNALQGRIPGLTVVSSHGEPGYDNPTLYVRGQSSWNIAGNQVVIFLDGFQVDMNALSALSSSEIETITLLKDAAALAVYGLNGGAGVLSVRTKEGTKTGKTKIEVSAKYGGMHTIALPKVMDAFGYVSAYNQALQNDGLPIKYYNPELYKANDDPFHPNVNWYDKLLTNTSALQDYNISFRGGNETARFYVLGGYTNFTGAYKDADIIDIDYGTNAKYRRLNLRANLDLQLNKNLSVKATVSGITEDRNTPSGFTAASVFSNLMKIPAAAFPVMNLDGSWGNNSVYNFNPVQLLRRNGVYNSHTRYLQTNVSFNQKLDALVSGLALSGGVSFSNVYTGVYDKKFAVASYEISKDAFDNPVIDANGNIVYKVLGSSTESITDGGNSHWNRTSAQLGFDYAKTFGKNTFTGMLKATRSSYVHDGQTYAVVDQGLRGFVTYDYAKKYVADLSFSYLGSGDFESGHQYGLFPAIGLGWIISNEDFLKNNSVINFLKLRGSYGLTANTNESSRFLYERWASYTANVYVLGTTDGGRNGRTEGAYANGDFTWEAKQTANLGLDATLFKKLNATVDLFREKRTDILEAPVGVPDYTGFNFRNTNSGEVVNKGFEVNLQFRDKAANNFEYNVGAYVAYARNEITKKAENPQPYEYLYQKGYRIGQMRGLEYAGFYQVSDFTGGVLNTGVVKSTYGQVQPGDLKYVDQNGDGLISDYDKVPMDFAKLPEITAGFNLGFKYAGFDFEAFVQGVMNRTVSLLDDAFDFTHPLANNNNITVFSNNPWTPQTANTATSPRLSTLVNNNNNQASDFWLRSGNFFKLRSVELGYTLPKAGFLKKLENTRLYISGNNLLGNKIEGLEPERLSMGYPLMKTVTFGVKAKF